MSKSFRKPAIVYKNKSPISKLSYEEAGHMKNILYGGLMKTYTPPHIEEQFLKQGYIYKATGGLMPTEAGHHAFMLWQKGGGK